MTAQARMTLTDNPTNEEIIDALDTIRIGGSLTMNPEDGPPDWPLAVVRYVNELGPDTAAPFGVMAYERVATVAAEVSA